jgi:hypothetical protein
VRDSLKLCPVLFAEAPVQSLSTSRVPSTRSPAKTGTIISEPVVSSAVRYRGSLATSFDTTVARASIAAPVRPAPTGKRGCAGGPGPLQAMLTTWSSSTAYTPTEDGPSPLEPRPRLPVPAPNAGHRAGRARGSDRRDSGAIPGWSTIAVVTRATTTLLPFFTSPVALSALSGLMVASLITVDRSPR